MAQIGILILICLGIVSSLDNGLGRTPPMGWNSWNHFGCKIDEKLILQTAKQLISSGLAAKGYVYVNLDDCWQLSRDKTGKIEADPKTFPSGIAKLAQEIHALGLKIGLYSDAGSKTCQGRPGGLGYEQIDAQTYAEWNIDYLKYDNCYDEGISPKIRFPPMRDALNKTGKPIYFSMCEWGVENPWEWATSVGNSWRTTGDIQDKWDSFIKILDAQVGLEKYAGPGHWNDPDMLQVGNGGMTEREYEAHFSLWAALKSPLLIGCDIQQISRADQQILQNEEIIAINQDALGVQASRLFRNEEHNWEVWGGPLQDNDWVFVLFNRDEREREIQFQLEDVWPHGQVAYMRNLLEHRDLPMVTTSYKSLVYSHAVHVLRANMHHYPQQAVTNRVQIN